MGKQSKIIDLFSNAHLKVFDWSDDYEQFTQDPRQRASISKTIEYYLSHADIVFTINDRLTERAKVHNSTSFTIPNATNMFTFPVMKDTGSLPRDLVHIEHPIIGYMGWLNELRMDLELIEYIASARPMWNFIFIGPESHKLPLGTKIKTFHNVHILKPVEYQLLPSVLNLWDVCILPNKINAHTMGNDPIKIYDYLATGKPLVSTRTAGTERVVDYVYLADTKEQFLEHLDAIIAGKDSISQKDRIEKAFDNSWKNRFSEIMSVLHGYLKN